MLGMVLGRKNACSKAPKKGIHPRGGGAIRSTQVVADDQGWSDSLHLAPPEVVIGGGEARRAGLTRGVPASRATQEPRRACVTKAGSPSGTSSTCPIRLGSTNRSRPGFLRPFGPRFMLF